jgi:hypothetical protein
MKRIATVVAGVVLALGLYVAMGTNPLETGSVFAQDPMGLDPSGEFYVYAPNADYYLMTGIRNGGPFPVSIKGPHRRGDQANPGPNAVEYLLARGADPTAEIAARADAAPFTGIELAPGDEVGVWVHFHTGPCPDDGTLPLPPGSGTAVEDTLVDWTLFGVPRVSEVPLSQDLQVRNVDSPDICAH